MRTTPPITRGSWSRSTPTRPSGSGRGNDPEGAAVLERGLAEPCTAIRRVNLRKAEPDTRRLVERTLRDFRRAGVDKDERRADRDAREQLVLISQEFDRNIRNDSRTIKLDRAADLDGLPGLREVPSSRRGRTDHDLHRVPRPHPDHEVREEPRRRRRLSFESRNRAYPRNVTVLTACSPSATSWPGSSATGPERST